MKRGFVIHHNGPAANCLGQPHSRCLAFWEAVKRFHTLPEPQGQGWSDVAYSWNVCPHGVRLGGRGWDRNQFANGTDIVGVNDGPDSEWYSVLVSIGIGEAPTPEMIRGVADLISEGRSSGRCGRRVLPHNAFKPKPCPGPEFTALARQWDNQPITIEEDDMTPDDHAKITEQLNDLRDFVAGAAKQTAKFVTVGGESSIFDPKGQGNGWMPGATNLPKLLAAVQEVDVDEMELAQALATPLSTAILDKLPPEVAEQLDFDDVVSAVVQGLGSVRLVPAAGT